MILEPNLFKLIKKEYEIMSNNVWQNDVFLREIENKLDEVELVSFDIFDTLLLRTISKTEDIFLEVGKRMLELYPDYYGFSPEVFAGLRREAEMRARRKAKDKNDADEITLDGIYDEFQLACDYVECAKKFELEIQYKNIYLNPNIVDFIHYCKKKKKQVAFISNSHLGQEHIRNCLYSLGVNIFNTEVIIVSGDFGVLKQEGRLFRILQVFFPTIPANRMLHIGNDYHADIKGAESAGMQAAYYGAMSCNLLHHISVEQNHFGNNLNAISSLRKLALNTIPQKYFQAEERFFFETGCSIFGVVYTFFAEWILDQAQKEGIKIILTFMREGELLSQIINRAAKKRGFDLKVVPIYISRRTTELIRHEKIDDSIINEYLHRPLLKLEDIFSIFYLDIGQSSFQKFKGETIEQCKANGHFSEIFAFFKSRPVISKINSRIKEQKLLLTEYIQSITAGCDAITVDIGFRGTMQDCLSRISANGTGRFIHLLLMGLPYNARFLLDGIPIRGWLGYGGENSTQINKIYQRIQVLEAATNADIGTTIAYGRQNKNIIPILQSVDINKDNKRKKEILWQGIYHFQNLWFLLYSKKTYLLEKILGQREEFLSLLLRLLTLPTNDEALYLGQLYYDESSLFSSKAAVCKKEDFDLYDNSINEKKFLDKCESSIQQCPVYWPEGIVAQREPDYFQKEYLNALGNQHYKKLSRIFLNPEFQNKRIAVYGAGAIGRDLVEAAAVAGFKIECIVDMNPKLQNRFIYGIKVISPKQSIDMAEVFIVTPIRFEKEIRKTLSKLGHERNKKIYMLLYE